MRFICTLTLMFASFIGVLLPLSAQTVSITPDLQIRKLTDHVYLYTSWADIGSWGRVGSNGVIVTNNKKAILLDTPTDEPQTVTLLEWFRDNIGAIVTDFVPNHWHGDCVGGLDYLNRIGVKTYSNQRTNDILKEKKLPQTQTTFADSLTLNVGKVAIQCYFLGGGHATDNIVVWIPSDSVLFGGCMLKDCSSSSVGNTSDAAPLTEWLETIQRVEDKFPSAQIVIPGHGEAGGKEVLEHTKTVLRTNIP